MDEVTIPIRNIVRPKKGEDGLFVQPPDVGPDREVEENHNRLRAANHGHYADPWTGNTRTYDPQGNYPCGECNMADETQCLLIERDKPIDLVAGSCEHWENTCAGDPEQLNKRVSANYGAAENGEGFGCHRCLMQETAVAPDSRGRDLYCKFWECRVLSTACCAYNNAPTVAEDDTDRASSGGVMKRASNAVMIRRVVPAQVSALADDEVEVIMSTAGIARDGHVLVPQGAQLEAYRKNPIVLWQHDPEHPVGRSEAISVDGDRLIARVRFAPSGISTKADEIRGLVKAGIISAVSVGFEPKDGEPLDPKRPRGGMRFTEWELLECSFCSVPVDTNAMVTARADVSRHKETAGMSKESDTGLKARHTRALERAPRVPLFKRGLSDVAQLAYMLQQLGYCHECAEYEAALEGDASPVPGMLGEGLVKFGQALIEMAQEEVRELLDEKDLDEEDDEPEMETRELSDDERAYIGAGKTPRARAWRRGIALCRSGRTLSASNEKRLNEASAHHERAMKHHRAIGEHADAATEHLAEMHDLHARAVDAYGDLGTTLESVENEPTKATEHVARALKQYRAIGSHLEDMAHTHEAMTDVHGDLGDAHHSLGRALKAAQRSVRAVVEGSNPAGEDNDSKTIQKSSGTAEDEGSRSLDLARRKADLRALAEAAP